MTIRALVFATKAFKLALGSGRIVLTLEDFGSEYPHFDTIKTIAEYRSRYLTGETMRPFKVIFYAVAILCILGAMWHVYDRTKLKAYSPAELSANPKLLNGNVLSGVTFPKFVIKDVHLKGTTFQNAFFDDPVIENVVFDKAVFRRVTMRDLTFKNVTFNDCTFDNAQLWQGIFDNVTFNGGIFDRHGDSSDYYARTYISDMKFNNVTFNGVKFNRSRMGVSQGSVIFKNIICQEDKKRGESLPALISADNVKLSIESCDVRGVTFASLGSNSTVYVKNSTFNHSGFAGGGAKILYFENCSLTNASAILVQGDLVLKKCILNASIKGDGIWFLQDCSFLPNTDRPYFTTGFVGKSTTCYYVLGADSEVLMGHLGGTGYIFDTKLKNARFLSAYNATSSLNLRNVDIHGGDWSRFTMEGGQWENVRIYPPVELDNTSLGKLRTHKLEFPMGSPWQGSLRGDLEESPTPFDWPEIHVPTPEELGLAK